MRSFKINRKELQEPVSTISNQLKPHCNWACKLDKNFREDQRGDSAAEDGKEFQVGVHEKKLLFRESDDM